MKYFLLLLLLPAGGYSQTRREDIHTDFVLYNRRVALEKDLRERIIGKHFTVPLDSNSEDGYLSGCWAVFQFLFDGPEVLEGFRRLFAGYDSLSYDTRRALLEAVYAVAPGQYIHEVGGIFDRETDARLFALCAVYLYRQDTSTANANQLKIRLVEKFPSDTPAVLEGVEKYLRYKNAYVWGKAPGIWEVLGYHRGQGQKMIYSFHGL